MADIIEDIDALVDWQLEQEASGYDHNINQERCRCGRDWHGLPITQRIDSMRSFGRMDPEYSVAGDDSPVMCVGSNMSGPWRVEPLDASAWLDPSAWAALSPWQTIRDPARQARFGAFVAQQRDVSNRLVIEDGSPYMVGRDFELAEGERVGWDNGDGIVHIGRVESHEPDGNGGWTITVGPDNAAPSASEMIHTAMTMFGDFAQSFAAGMESARAGLSGIASHLDMGPDTRTPQQRALPRPSTTPPMWAHDPTRSRRPRRNRNQPNRQGIA